MNSFRKLTQTVVIAVVLAVQFFYASGVGFVQAQGLANPIDTTKPAADLPTYQGVDGSIRDYLCTPEGTGTDLYDCIGKLYRFGISFGAIALVFFLVIAGYIYLSGGEAAKGKAKNMLYSAFTGMAILLGSYLLLSFINPELVKIKTIQPPIFEALDLPKCEDIGFSTKCIISTGSSAGQVSGGVAGSANEAQYKSLIAKYASANGIEYCALSALIQKESTFNRYARSNPAGSIDPSKGPPTYNQSFDVYHAIGLTQITIYPKGKGGWVGDTPARSSKADFGKSPLTLEMLLDPETNISAGGYFFAKLVKKNNGNLRSAYDDFQSGAGDTRPGDDSDPKTLNKYMDMYNACKRR